jgi:hypothetical protein
VRCRFGTVHKAKEKRQGQWRKAKAEAAVILSGVSKYE